MRGAVTWPLGRPPRLWRAVDQQLRGCFRRAVLPALDEEVATQVGVGYGLRQAAVALQLDGLEGHQRFQVALWMAGSRLVEDEAEPGEG